MSEGAAAPRRRKTHAKAAPQLAPQTEPEQMKSEATATAPSTPVSEREEIARLAYSYWEARGHGGSAEEDWLRAEAEFGRRREASTN